VFDHAADDPAAAALLARPPALRWMPGRGRPPHALPLALAGSIAQRLGGA
jgi:hypothetical protein